MTVSTKQSGLVTTQTGLLRRNGSSQGRKRHCRGSMFDISPTEWTAILLSLRVAAVATLVATPIGVGVAWLLARRDFWGKPVFDAAIHLPLVLPPVVTG